MCKHAKALSVAPSAKPIRSVTLESSGHRTFKASIAIKTKEEQPIRVLQEISFFKSKKDKSIEFLQSAMVLYIYNVERSYSVRSRSYCRFCAKIQLLRCCSLMVSAVDKLADADLL